MRALVASILLGIVSVGLSAAGSTGAAPDRPAGIGASDWVPLSNSLGLVVLHPRERTVTMPVPDPTALLIRQPLQGYLMIRRGRSWQRLVIVNGPE